MAGPDDEREPPGGFETSAELRRSEDPADADDFSYSAPRAKRLPSDELDADLDEWDYERGEWTAQDDAGAPATAQDRIAALVPTGELLASVLVIAALAIAALTSEAIDATRFWYLVTAVVIAYVLSRGIAKSGTKSRSQ